MIDTHKSWAERMLVGGGNNEDWQKCQGVARAYLSQQAELTALRNLRDRLGEWLTDLSFSPSEMEVRQAQVECEQFKERP